MIINKETSAIDTGFFIYRIRIQITLVHSKVP